MTSRVQVFIDGQNLYKGVSRAYGLRVHPILLAHELAGDRTLVGTHYYSGVHRRSENQRMHDLVEQRLQVIERTGVQVSKRTLRYHWEWVVDDDLPPAWKDNGPGRTTAKVKRYRRAREKGVDVALALDAAAAALTDECDVVIIVSRDRDLMEVADEISERCDSACVQVEVAYVSEGRGDEEKLPAYDAHHFIDRDVAQRCADAFDYDDPLDEGAVTAFIDSLELKGQSS